MSLIYSAITSLENKHAGGDSPEMAPASIPASQTIQETSKRWLYVAGIGSVAAVVIGGSALAVMRERLKEMPPASASTPNAVALAPQADAPQQSLQHPPAERAAQQQLAAPARKTSMPESVVLVKKPVEQVAELEATKPHAFAKPEISARHPHDMTAKAPQKTQPAQAGAAVKPVRAKPTDGELNNLTTATKQAIDSGNQEEAESLLGQLSAHLPPESITLLRLRAWQALRNNEQSSAIALYGQIVERLPLDESASINLAVLNWKAGQHDEARRIISGLAERRPDSDVVRRYAAQFGEQR